MRIFSIIADKEEDAEKIRERLASSFDDDKYKELRNKMCWMIAANGAITVSDLSTLILRPTADENDRIVGVVFQIAGYNGLYDPGLWEKLNLWQAS